MEAALRSRSRVSRVGLGCSRVGSFNNPTPISEIRELLSAALDLGVSVFDTSNVYGQGQSESEIGRALGSRRGEAFIVTKLGKTFSAKMRALAFAKPLVKALLPARVAKASVTGRREREMSTDFSPANFATTLEASLKRLGTDRVDGLLLHSPTADQVRVGGVGEALAALKLQGKVLNFGVSCDDMACLEAALELPGLTLLQLPLDLLDEAAAKGVISSQRREGLIIMAREIIRLSPNLAPDAAIAQASARAEVDCVVIGTSRVKHLQQAVAAAGSSRAAE